MDSFFYFQCIFLILVRNNAHGKSDTRIPLSRKHAARKTRYNMRISIS